MTPTNPHGPNRYHRYLATRREIHETVLAKFRDEHFLISDDLELLDFGEGLLMMAGWLNCDRGIRVRVRKTIRTWRDDDGARWAVKERYTYHAMLQDDTHVLRYDGPDEHRPYHHKHICQPFRTPPVAEKILRIAEEDTPTLGAVLEELRLWMWDSIAELDARGH